MRCHRRRARLLLVAPLAAALLALAGCGGDEERASLAIEKAEWADATHLFVFSECAIIDDVEVDRSGELVEVSLWGAPKNGTCNDWVVVKVDAGTTKIVDGATSQVVDLPTYVPDPNGGVHGSPPTSTTPEGS